MQYKKKAFSGIGFILAIFMFGIALFITMEYYHIFTTKESVDIDVSRALNISVDLAMQDIDWIQHNSVMDTTKAEKEFKSYLINDMGLNSNYEKYDSNGEFLYQIIIDETKIQRTPAKFKVSGRIRMKSRNSTEVSCLKTFDVPFSEESKNTRYDDKQGGAEYEYNGC